MTLKHDLMSSDTFVIYQNKKAIKINIFQTFDHVRDSQKNSLPITYMTAHPVIYHICCDLQLKFIFLCKFFLHSNVLMTVLKNNKK